jgi:sugar phosphate isomerase/epimerase
MITLSGYGDEISPVLKEQLDVLAGEGIRYIDLRSVEGKNVLDWTKEEAARIKKRMDERGIKAHSISSPIGKSSITGDFAPRLKEFMRAVELAHFFDTPYIRIFSFYPPKGDNPRKYRAEVIRRIRRLTQIAERERLILMLENEKLVFGDTGDRLREIMEAIRSPHLRIAFDPANFVQSQVIPMTDAYPQVEPYISWVQMKDALVNTGKNVPLGTGDGQIRLLLRALKERGFSGFISVESHLQPEGELAGLSIAQLFLINVRALKEMMTEAGLKWK